MTQTKLCCNIMLKNNDVYLKLYYNTHEIKLKDIIIYILEYKNNEYIIDPLSTASNKLFKSTLKKFGFTDLEIDIVKTVRKYDVVDPIDLTLQSKNNPDKIPKLSIDEYLKLEDPLQQNLYKLIPKQDALQNKLNFIAHLLRTYNHTVIQAVATKTDNLQTVVENNIDDIIKLLEEG